MSKRQKIVFAAMISAGLALTALVTNFLPGLVEVVVVGGISYLVCAWALQPDLDGWEYATLLALPVMLTVGTVLTGEKQNLPVPGKYFLPVIYGGLLYLSLLAENIFNVSVHRTIPLLRAARTVGYLLTLATVFLLASLIFTLHVASYFNFLMLFLVGGVAVGQALWQVELAATNRRKLVLASLVSALSVGELGLVVSFWPAHPLAAGLVITTLVYFLIGMIQHDWQENLDRRTVVEYVLVGVAVLVLLIFTTSWTG